ncbi:hypothetical protein AMATHDRAFT_167602, partial [Amanita thiersii Skay4041]
MGIGPYRIEMLQGHNWVPWKRRMSAILRDQGLEKYILPKAAKPTEETEGAGKEKEKAWIEGDSKARTQIELAVSDSELDYLAGAATAREMWEQLCNAKEAKGRVGIMST